MSKKQKKERKSKKKEAEKAAKKKAKTEAKVKRKEGKKNLYEKLESKKTEEGLRYIVRIANKDLDGTLPIYRSLMGIQGISHRFGKTAAMIFEKKTGVRYNERLGKIDEKFDKQLEDIILNPENHGMPNWILNRQRDFDSGKSRHVVMGDLQFAGRNDIKRLNEIKSYRGLRHSWGLPVRGQRTKSTHRGKGPVVGVMKKEAAKK